MMIKTAFNLFIAIAFMYTAYVFFVEKGERRATYLHSYYQEHAIDELGANNVVASIVVSYRGLDTLGEVTILFLSALLITFILGFKDKGIITYKLKESSEILETATDFLVPFIFILGAYIIFNGHLTPGGGFQGGAVLSTGLILLIVTNITKKVRISVLKFIESVSGIAYVFVAVLGIVWGVAILDPTLLPKGQLGHIFSAGLIPVIYIFIGMKVGAELSAIFYSIKQEDSV